MKKLLLTLAWAVGAINSGFAADLYVNNSGQSGTYTSIQTALNVASSGDRIFVSPYGVYSEDLTISKSITIAPSVSGSNIVLNGTITFWPEANDEINLIGVNGLGCALTTNTITATVNSKAIINVISCVFSTSMNLANSAIIVNSSFSTFQSFTLTYGNTIGCTVIGNLVYNDGPNLVLNDTNLIIANKIESRLIYQNDDYFYRISNNKVRYGININRAVYNSNIKNYITNNWINQDNNASGSSDGITFWFQNTSDNFSNVIVIGNVNHVINHVSTSSYTAHIFYFSGPTGTIVSSSNSPVMFYNLLLYSQVTGNGSLNIIRQSSNVTGSFTQGYNYAYNDGTDLNGYLTIENTGRFGFKHLGPDDKQKISLSNYFSDKNSPSTEYQDLDLSPGDLGVWGGPYSWDNYWYESGRSRILHIDLPSEIWPGQTVNLKAEAVHTN